MFFLPRSNTASVSVWVYRGSIPSGDDDYYKTGLLRNQSAIRHFVTNNAMTGFFSFISVSFSPFRPERTSFAFLRPRIESRAPVTNSFKNKRVTCTFDGTVGFFGLSIVAVTTSSSNVPARDGQLLFAIATLVVGFYSLFESLLCTNIAGRKKKKKNLLALRIPPDGLRWVLENNAGVT